MAKEQEAHPLEGKHIIFKFTEYTPQCYPHSALALFLLRNNDLKKIYNPSAVYPYGEIDEDESNEKLLKKIIRRKIGCVYSVSRGEDFFNIPYGFVSDSLDESNNDEEDENGDENEETGFEYETPEEDDYGVQLLKDAGIEIHYYSEVLKREI